MVAGDMVGEIVSEVIGDTVGIAVGETRARLSATPTRAVWLY